MLCIVATLCCVLWQHCVVYCGNTVLCIVATLCCVLWQHCAVYCGNTVLCIVATLCCILWQQCAMYCVVFQDRNGGLIKQCVSSLYKNNILRLTKVLLQCGTISMWFYYVVLLLYDTMCLLPVDTDCVLFSVEAFILILII